MDLQELRARIALRDSLKSEQEALFQRETELRERLRREGTNLQYEESDVEEMEGTNLKSIFYTVIGKKEERLNRELDEAEAARAQYERTKAELEDVKKRIKQIERELGGIARAEADYKKQVREIEDRIRTVEGRMSEADTVTLSIIRREIAEMDQKQDCYARIKAAGAEILRNVESVRSILWDMYQKSHYGDPFTERELYNEANAIKCLITRQVERFHELLAEASAFENEYRIDAVSVERMISYVSAMCNGTRESRRAYRSYDEIRYQNAASLEFNLEGLLCEVDRKGERAARHRADMEQRLASLLAKYQA
jgi:hypothetical protein